MSLLDRLRRATPRQAATAAPVSAAGTSATVARRIAAAPSAWRDLAPLERVTAGRTAVAGALPSATRWQQAAPRLTHAAGGGPTGLVGGLARVIDGRLPPGPGPADGPPLPALDLPLVQRPAALGEPDGLPTPTEVAPLPTRRLAPLPAPEGIQPASAAPRVPPLPLVTPGAPPDVTDAPAAPGRAASSGAAIAAAPDPTPGPRARQDVPVGLGGPALRLVRRSPRADPVPGRHPTPSEPLPLAPFRPDPRTVDHAPEQAPAGPADRTPPERSPLDARPLGAVRAVPEPVRQQQEPIGPGPDRPLLGPARELALVLHPAPPARREQVVEAAVAAPRPVPAGAPRAPLPDLPTRPAEAVLAAAAPGRREPALPGVSGRALPTPPSVDSTPLLPPAPAAPGLPSASMEPLRVRALPVVGAAPPPHRLVAAAAPTTSTVRLPGASSGSAEPVPRRLLPLAVPAAPVASTPPLTAPALGEPLPATSRVAAGLALAAAEVDAATSVPTESAIPVETGPAETGTPVPGSTGPDMGALADQLYDEVRWRLRDELLLGRERSATLADL